MKRKMNHPKKRWGDRSDGRRVRSKDPLFPIIPYIMSNRCDCQVFFNDEVDVTYPEKFIRNLRHETDMKELSMLHLMLAVMLRVISQYPCLNRFIAGNKIYARNSISFSFMIKRKLTLDAEELCVKVELDPADDLQTVYQKVNAAMEAAKSEESTDTSKMSVALSLCPSWILRLFIGLVRGLDNKGWLPQSLIALSPFHCTMYINDMGSIGIQSVYHHLYNFGTCSVFFSLGKKSRDVRENADGTQTTLHKIPMRVTVDERIVGGYYFASAMRYCAKVLKNPEELLLPPKQVNVDPEAGFRSNNQKTDVE